MLVRGKKTIMERNKINTGFLWFEMSVWIWWKHWYICSAHLCDSGGHARLINKRAKPFFMPSLHLSLFSIVLVFVWWNQCHIVSSVCSSLVKTLLSESIRVHIFSCVLSEIWFCDWMCVRMFLSFSINIPSITNCRENEKKKQIKTKTRIFSLNSQQIARQPISH